MGCAPAAALSMDGDDIPWSVCSDSEDWSRRRLSLLFRELLSMASLGLGDRAELVERRCVRGDCRIHCAGIAEIAMQPEVANDVLAGVKAQLLPAVAKRCRLRAEVKYGNVESIACG